MKNKVINLFDKLQDEETKYSKLVAQFIKPFVNDVTDTEEYKEIVELGIKAWNIANVKIIIPIGEVEDAIHSFKDEEIDIDLLNKMVTYKMDHFKAYTHFIVDY